MPNLVLRLPADLHDLLRLAAATRRQSMQAYMLAAIRAQMLRDAGTQRGAPLAAALERRAPQGGRLARSLIKRNGPRVSPPPPPLRRRRTAVDSARNID